MLDHKEQQLREEAGCVAGNIEALLIAGTFVATFTALMNRDQLPSYPLQDGVKATAPLDPKSIREFPDDQIKIHRKDPAESKFN